MNGDDTIPRDDVVIRRYLKLNAFLELLYGQFVQVRPDAFNDAAEGAYFTARTIFAPAVYERLRLPPASRPDQIVREARLHTLATCWYEGDRESFGMWSVYGRLQESVAIETTVGSLKLVLAKSQPHVRIERLRYTQLDTRVEDFGELFLYKREEYEYEREIRSIWTAEHRFGAKVHNSGLTMQELRNFIRRIILAPGSRQMFYDAVRFIVDGAFNIANLRYEGRIDRSTLDALVIRQEDA